LDTGRRKDAGERIQRLEPSTQNQIFNNNINYENLKRRGTIMYDETRQQKTKQLIDHPTEYSDLEIKTLFVKLLPDSDLKTAFKYLKVKLYNCYSHDK